MAAAQFNQLVVINVNASTRRLASSRYSATETEGIISPW
jgi:hypothetical protein